jgi:putative FmdB family regulatory protein
MPIFEYECRRCGHRFEAIVSGSRKAACPECGGRRLEKLLSVFAAGSGRDSAAGAGDPGGGDFDGGCGSCGDPRGPGSCGVN